MLTDRTCSSAKALDSRDYKLGDSRGLFLLVTKAGGKYWRLKYRFAGKEGQLAFGPYPYLSLAQARSARDAALQLIRNGVNPSVERRKNAASVVDDAQKTLEVAARLWHGKQTATWSNKHGDDVLRSLERDVFPSIGRIPVSRIDETLIYAVLKRIEERGAVETAHRVRQRLETVFHFAKGVGMPNSNPAAAAAASLSPMPPSRRQPAVVEFADVRSLLTAVEDQPAHPVTLLAHRLLALTAVRPGVLRLTETEAGEFEGLDGPSPIWRIPAQRMKLGTAQKCDPENEFVVPLSVAAVNVIRAVRLMTGRSKYMFPSVRSHFQPMSENTINFLLHRAGYQGRQVGHGWRSSFATIMNERAERAGTSEADGYIIDLMLAHAPKDKVAAAYNRARFLPRRREIAEQWSALLTEGLRTADELLLGRRR